MAMSNVMNTYGRLPVSFVKGSGAYLQDDEGNQYLDALTGIAVCGLGHAHPKVARAQRPRPDLTAHLQSLRHSAPNPIGRTTLHLVGHGQRVLLQLGRRGQ